MKTIGFGLVLLLASGLYRIQFYAAWLLIDSLSP